MRDYLFLAGILLFVIFLVGVGNALLEGRYDSAPTHSPLPKALHVKIGSSMVFAEIADTPEARGVGLGERVSLPEDRGMLFIFQESGRYGFWMAGMHFPIDIIWISEEKKIVGITDAAPPPSPSTAEKDLPVYFPPRAVRYVLEVNAGWANAHGIQVGDEVSW